MVKSIIKYFRKKKVTRSFRHVSWRTYKCGLKIRTEEYETEFDDGSIETKTVHYLPV